MNRFKSFLISFLSLMLITSSAAAQAKTNPSTQSSKTVRRPLPKPLAGSRGFERYAGRDASARLIAAAATRSPGTKYFEQGLAYSESGKNKEAIEAFQKAVELDAKNPKLFWAVFNLGNSYADDGQYEKAIAAYKQTLSLQANFPRAYYNLGVAYVELNRTEDAIRAFREAIKQRVDHAMAYYNLGVLYGTVGDYREAAAAFKQALVLKRQGVEVQYALDEAHFNLGLALLKLNQKAEAMEHYQALKELKSKLGDELFALIAG